jgi:hypothetical protein
LKDSCPLFQRCSAARVRIKENLCAYPDRCARVERCRCGQARTHQISWGVDLHEAEVRSVPSGNQVAGDSSGVLPGFWMQHRARRIVVDSEWIKATFGICHRYQNVRANRRLVWTGLRAARQGYRQRTTDREDAHLRTLASQ